MKTQIIILGVDLSDDYKAGSQRVRNLFDTIIDNPDYRVVNILLNKENKNNNLVCYTNTQFIHKQGILKYLKVCFLIYQIKQTQQNTVIYNYGSVATYNIQILLWAKLIGIPIVFDIVENNHSAIDYKSYMAKIKYIFIRFFGKRLYLFANKIFVISNSLLSQITDFSRNRVPVVHIPISVRLKEWELPFPHIEQSKQIIFYGGSFGPKDGLDYLIDAFQNISKEFPTAELHLSGQGAPRHLIAVKNKIESMECKDYIHLLGALSRKNYIKAIFSSDIVCVTRINSVFANYGFPFKLGEYLAAGKAIIVSNVSDISLYLEHKKDVWIVQPESSYEIEAGIRGLLTDSELRKGIGLNAKKKAELHFDSKLIGAKFQREIDEIFNASSKIKKCVN